MVPLRNCVLVSVSIEQFPNFEINGPLPIDALYFSRGYAFLNLLSRKYQRPSRMFVMSLIPLSFAELKTLLGVGLIKTLKLPTF